jgi:flagellar protein FlaJ
MLHGVRSLYTYISSIRKFGTYFAEKRSSHADLIAALRQARIPIPVDKYLARSAVVSLLVAVGALLLSVLICIPLYTLFGAKVFLLAIPVPLVFGGIAYYLFSYYPKFRSGEIAASIDRSLPSAITYMYALSRGGLELVEILESLARQRHVYGGVADHVGYVVRDIRYLNIDIIKALHDASERSPSRNMRDFLDGLVMVIDSGGSLTEYFKIKSSYYYKQAGADQEKYLNTLGMIAEGYITVFVAGPLFLMTILVVVGMIDSSSIILLNALIYGLIPGATLLCVLLLSTMAGSREEAYQVPAATTKSNVFEGVGVKPAEIVEDALFTRLETAEKIKKYKKFFKNPVKTFFENPVYALYITVPAALIYVVIAIYMKGYLSIGPIIATLSGATGAASGAQLEFPSMSVLDDVVVFGMFVLLVPFTFFYESRARRIKNMEREMPEFLRRLASMNEAGLTLTSSIKASLRSKLGVLDSEIRRMWRDIEWGASTSVAMTRFEERVRTAMISRTITLIIKANEAVSDIRQVLQIAAADSEASYRLKMDRLGNMTEYVMIVYLAFFIFLFIVYVLAAQFVSMVPTGDASENLSQGMEMLAQYDAEKYILLMFHATLIQGFCSGLVGGTMGEGNVYSGFKHSIIMVAIAYVTFRLLGLA